MKEKRYRVLNLVEPESANRYPEIYRADSAEFPHLLDYIEDESATMVLDLETQDVYPDSEFFAMVGHGWVIEFTTKELPEDDPTVKWPKE